MSRRTLESLATRSTGGLKNAAYQLIGWVASGNFNLKKSTNGCVQEPRVETIPTSQVFIIARPRVGKQAILLDAREEVHVWPQTIFFCDIP